MHDLKAIVANPDAFRARLTECGDDCTAIGRIVELAEARSAAITQLDEARATHKEHCRKIGLEKRQPTASESELLSNLSNRISELKAEQDGVSAELHDLMLTIPNLPLDDVPKGENEKSNRLGEAVGDCKPAPHGKAHWDIADELGLYDLKAGVNASGARFYFLTGLGARLHRALINWMLDMNTEKFGYTEIEPPVLVKRDTMTGSGNLPKFAENLYHDDETDLWLIPTAEVALNGYYQGEIIPASKLPIKFVAVTNCFRKEHAGAGRDVRGIKRVHQFQKVEMFRIETPETALAAHDEMVAQISTLCAELGLTYRVVQLCGGDLGFQSARTYDVEVWAAGSQDWLEVSSISTCTDFQARRTNTRYKQGNDKPRFPHTLNGSALALPRIWAAILEANYADGSVKIPAVLQPYTKFAQIGNA